MNSSEMNEPINIPQVFIESFLIYKKEFSKFIIIGLAYGFANVLPGFLLQYLFKNNMSIIFLATILLTSWVSIALFHCSDLVLRKRKVDLQKVFVKGKDVYWVFVSVTIFYFLIVFTGFVLMVLPGLYFLTIFMFADVIVVLEKKKILEAFRTSMDMVHQYFWPIVRFNGFVLTIYVTPILIFHNIPQIGQTLSLMVTILIVPYYVLTQINLFHQLKARLQNII